MQQSSNPLIYSAIGALTDFDAWLAGLTEDELDVFASKMSSLDKSSTL